MSNFLFPIETTARELDHKILMAIQVAEPGRKIFVGDQQIIRTLSYLLKGGVFYGKHLFGKPMFSDKKYYNRLKSNNFKLVHLNEEGAVWPGDEPEWKKILMQAERPSQLSSDDFMATWGKWQKDFNESYEPTSAQIRVTGHPRFDLYSERYKEYFEKDTESLKNKYGDFILVNTAFSYSNNGEGGVRFIFKSNLAYDVNNAEHRSYRFKRWKQQMFSLADIVDLVNKISVEFPEKKIVIRPHPSESTEYYKDIFQNIKNVHVIYEGAVSPWILACSMLIHNGCTTAIEATLAGKMVINYSTRPDPSFDVFLASSCGSAVSEASEVLKLIKANQVNKISGGNPICSKALSLFHNFENENTAELNLQVLNEADSLVIKAKVTSLSQLALKVTALYHRLYLFGKYTFLTLKGRYADFVDYRKRFEPLKKNDISMRVKLLSKILNKNVKVTFVSSKLFVIEHVK